jgi:hypothetical protein
MTFDAEMLPYCGRRFRVLRRVERIIEESSGRKRTTRRSAESGVPGQANAG